jgi:EmrB/QacA subfamily drug resistance transporter
LDNRQRWIALAVLCLGTLMIVIDATIVNVALPSIGADLGFSEAGLTWVVNAYLLVFGGFLLLGGRLGDLYGARRVFVLGIAAFTLASLVCGLAKTQAILIAARAVQGLGGAVVDSVSLALIVRLFVEPGPRAKAMGVYGFVCAAGGSIGVLAGGLLTGAFGWHWIFLVNVPIGVGVIALCFALLPKSVGMRGARLDIGGAVTITLALLLLVYAVIDANRAGWLSYQTLVLGTAAVVLIGAFAAIERRVRAPLMPLGLLTVRNVAVANVVGVLWSAGMFAWFFLTALYLQRVLGYDPLQVGLAFLPSNLLMAACSLGLSAACVQRWGLRLPLVASLALGALGLALFARAPLDGGFIVDVLPAMLLLGLSTGIGFNPLLLAAVSDVPESESGLASGMVNTAFMMGGALGLAVLASLADAGTDAAEARGAAEAAALAAGYRIAFVVGALATALAAVIALALRPAAPSPGGASRADAAPPAPAAGSGRVGT